MRRATFRDGTKILTDSISIHALREEGDLTLAASGWEPADISIHALREEGDRISARYSRLIAISIHALREEGDKT